MTAEVVLEPGRQRPQSGGFRTFLSWLKRDERTSSRESISSCDSDNTVASFAFLTPAHYKLQSHVKPVVVPPPGPPTDSYRKRVKDRNLRLHLDRNLTLCRKYNLTAEPVNYDAFSLPNERRNLTDPDRTRRATSVYLQRRAPYVPGKRHAPAPPVRASSLGPLNETLNRKSRKRQAPQPPHLQLKVNNETRTENIGNNQSKTLVSPASSGPQNKLQKNETKENMQENLESNKKAQSERSFLKQIFEGKKRISVCDPMAVRLLPSISELDRQAAEIMQMKLRNERLKNKLRTDINRVPVSNGLKVENNANNLNAEMKKNEQINNKQELKKILKEMKDSLPKRTKQFQEKSSDDNLSKKSLNSQKFTPLDVSAPLPISLDPSVPGPSWQSPFVENSEKKSIQKNDHNMKFQITIKSTSFQPIQTDNSQVKQNKLENVLLTKSPAKSNGSIVQVEKCNYNVKQATLVENEIVENMNNIVKNSTEMIKSQKISPNTKKDEANIEIIENKPELEKLSNIIACKDEKEKPVPSTSYNQNVAFPTFGAGPNLFSENKGDVAKAQHKKLIFELEKCIVEGDEHGAAKSARQLAQLGISGTILSDSLLTKIENDSAPSGSKPIYNEPIRVVSVNNMSHIVKNKSNNFVNKVAEPAAENDDGPIPDVVSSTSTQNLGVQLENQPIALKINNDLNSTTSSSAAIGVMKKTVNDNKNDVRRRVVKNEAIDPPPKQSKKEAGGIAWLNIYVEDRRNTLGPMMLPAAKGANLYYLKLQIESRFNIPIRLQRWIVGKTLCTNDRTPLQALAGKDLTAPFYVYLVHPDTKQLPEKPNENMDMEELLKSEVYKELVQLERQAIVYNTDDFECPVCMVNCKPGEGIVLKECAHTFCKGCLTQAIQHSEETDIRCPDQYCFGTLQEREIRALVQPGVYEKWLAQGLAVAEHGAKHSFHCRTSDCTGWALCEPGVTLFPCPVCQKNNCVPCETIHEGLTCKQHKSKLTRDANYAALDTGSKAYIENMIKLGEALYCPECANILTKQWGCDWVKCLACKTEICWVTRGRRWGPRGTGDTSGGCRCGVNGKKCHINCNYCH